MPAVETQFAATAVAPGNTVVAAAKKFSGPRPAGDDFDRAMSDALAPSNQKSAARKNLPPPGERTYAAGNDWSETNPGNAAAEPATAVSLKRKNSGDKADSKTDSGKKSAAAGGGYSADSNSAWVKTDAAEQLPSFLSVPFFSSLEVTPVAPGKGSPPGMSGTAEKFSPVVALPSAGSATAADLNGGERNPAPQPDKNSWLKNISPVPVASPVPLEKNISVPDAKKAGPGNFTPLMPAQTDPPVVKPAVAANEANASETKVDTTALPDTNTPVKNGDVNPAETDERAAENAGTGVATTVLPMKNPQKVNKVAGPGVKVLPVGETGSAREKNLPPALQVPPARAADNRGSDLNFAFSNGSSGAPVADHAPVLNAVDLPTLTDARMRAVERTHDMMALHSMRLTESKSDALSVVIKPSVGTELSLELRQRNGGVEAQATLTRGDHQFLSQHWPELQQRLELRGIKLAPLGGETTFSASDHGNFQQQTSKEDAAQQASAFAEFASAGNAGGATARLAPVHDGWESWA